MTCSLTSPTSPARTQPASAIRSRYLNRLGIHSSSPPTEANQELPNSPPRQKACYPDDDTWASPASTASTCSIRSDASILDALANLATSSSSSSSSSSGTCRPKTPPPTTTRRVSFCESVTVHGPHQDTPEEYPLVSTPRRRLRPIPQQRVSQPPPTPPTPHQSQLLSLFEPPAARQQRSMPPPMSLKGHFLRVMAAQQQR